MSFAGLDDARKVDVDKEGTVDSTHVLPCVVMWLYITYALLVREKERKSEQSCGLIAAILRDAIVIIQPWLQGTPSPHPNPTESKTDMNMGSVINLLYLKRKLQSETAAAVCRDRSYHHINKKRRHNAALQKSRYRFRSLIQRWYKNPRQHEEETLRGTTLKNLASSEWHGTVHDRTTVRSGPLIWLVKQRSNSAYI